METSKSLLDIVTERLSTSDAVLPAFDANALKIQQEAAKEEPDIQAIERLIAQDQALTGQVLKLANSAFYKGLNKVSTVKAAVIRLGTREVSNIVLLVSQKSSYRSKDPFIRKLMEQLWRHSVGCAVGSHYIARQAGFTDIANESFFAGLLHDIGKLLVLAVIEDAKKSGTITKDPPAVFLEEVIHNLHTDKGYSLLQSWNLPERYAVIARDHHINPYDTANHLLTIVRLADVTCNKLGIGIDPNSEIVLTATVECEQLGLSEIEIAQLEIKLEDSIALSQS
jgi:HD-like signal output (HDOD) protein